ncbi:MAG: FCD domain-containing protein, partial [Spirochaetota bacterium]|nr:FCD domain-containing protein [Spirochaetota bacterium]
AIAVGNEVHDYLIELAGNRYLKEFTFKLSSLMKLTRNLTKNRASIEENSRQDHLKILDALEKRDADLCEQLMDQHLNNTVKALAGTYLTSLTSFYA